MRFGVRIPPCETLDEVTRLVVRAEQVGYDTAWIPDSQLLWRDVWVAMGAAATRTSRIALGTNVTNIRTRHTTVVACAAASTEELAPSRFILGVGTGDTSVKLIGQPRSRLSEMRQLVNEIRVWLEGRHPEDAEPHVRMRPGSRRRVPIYFAAIGPKMFQLAGEMADGVITYAGTTSESLDTMWKNLEVGASRVGRDVGEIRVVNGLFCYIGDDWRRAQKLAQPHAARHAMRHPDLAAAFGVEPPDTDYAEVLYPDLVHADDWERAIEVTEWVPPDYLEWFCANYCLIGTKDQVAAQVEKMRHYGIAELYVHGFYSYKMPEEALERFAADVIPNFRRNTQLLSPGLNSRAVSQPPGSLNATGVGE